MTIINDMLSSPFYCWLFGAKRVSKMCYAVIFKGSLDLCLTIFIIYLFDFYSKIPSHPRTIYYVPCNGFFIISGLAVTICSSHFIALLDLNSKSPIPRDKFKHPQILPSVTVPPAFVILASYLGF